jgi:hypothetical protein
MGQTSSADALVTLRDALNDPDPDVARGAILALTAWDDPAPLSDLLTIAGNPAAANNLQVLALRGVLRLITLPSKRTARDNGILLRDAMRLASQTAEKRLVLSLLPSFPSSESLEVARAAAADAAVANEAKIALDQVTEALKTK